jgi:hypothetical protein
MSELEKTFRKENIEEPVEASFKPAVNKTRIESYGAEMLITVLLLTMAPCEARACVVPWKV